MSDAEWEICGLIRPADCHQITVVANVALLAPLVVPPPLRITLETSVMLDDLLVFLLIRAVPLLATDAIRNY
jgi:hypothetical protein